MYEEELQEILLCPGCNKKVDDHKIAEHIKSCERYPASVMRSVGNLGKSPPTSILKFLLEELELAKGHVRGLLFNSASVNGKKVESKPKSEIKQVQDVEFVSNFDRELVICKFCNRKFYANYDVKLLFYSDECLHMFCMPCITKYIDTEFVNQGGSLKCLLSTCKDMIPEFQIKSVVGEKKFIELQSKALRKMCNISECFKCKQEFELSDGNYKDAPKQDTTGNKLTMDHMKDYAINRFVCPNQGCKTQQCKTCQANPYHLGMTCKQYKAKALLKKCRYCNEPLTQKNASLTKIKALADICKAQECQESAVRACQKTNACGHSCYGYKDQKSCIPCLHETCAEKSPELNGVNADEYCAICYVQPLSAAPCVKSGCGHIFHVKCLKKRYEIRWLTPRILFNFCLCPLCKKWIQVTDDSELYKLSEENKDIFSKIQAMALERLKFQELEKTDQKLTTKTSQYFGKPMEYAMAIYAYFMCFKCKKPYFGGRKSCAEAMNQAGGEFKAEELICPNCCEIPIQNCPKHGKDFIEFKCKFCCNTAQWFCWGNTHFCQPCHKRQCNGDYVSKLTKEQLPKCDGPGKCPTGGNHNGNGDERMLGCAICRNYKENNKSF